MKYRISKENSDNLINAINQLIAKADDDLETQLTDEGFVATAEAVATVNAIEDDMTEALNNVCDDILERLQTATGLDNFIEDIWPTIRDAEDLRKVLREIVQQRFEELLSQVVIGFFEPNDTDLADAFVDDSRLTKPAVHFIENWSEQLAEIMELNTKDAIEKILVDGAKEHLSVVEVADKIAESGIRSPGYRARRVAQTEVLRVESYGQLEYMRQDPAVESKTWFHTGAHKNKPRPNHVAISGQTVPVDSPFNLTGADGASYVPMCPRDTCLPASESINCHCIMQTVRSEAKMGMSADDRKAMRQKYMDEVDKKYDEAQERFEADHGDDDDVSWEVYNSYFTNL